MLEIKSLYKNYDGYKVLDGLDFTIREGEIVSLLGGNGSGKTTTFKSILALTDCEGRIRLNKRLVDRKKTGYMPEQRSLFSDCTVHKQLQFMGRLKGMNDDSIETRLKLLYERTGTEIYKNVLPSGLSKGNQQKIQLLMAIVNDPLLLILDEPWTGLDRDNMQLFSEMLLEMKKQRKIILLSSHQHQQVQEICDRYLFLNNGKIALDITRKELEASSYCIIESRQPVTGINHVYGLKNSGNRCLLVAHNRLSDVMREMYEHDLIASVSMRPLNVSDLMEMQA
ncbi:MAG: ATP-binding cassette domain-containing protein [Erysipelotrichaceae bacterium]|nr:ATP-binding cassette domain-containing protein [Erysipelotrichaceae bacterium]